MDFRTATAIALIVLIYFYFFSPQPPVDSPATESSQSLEKKSEAPTRVVNAARQAEAIQAEQKPLSIEVLENELLRLEMAATGEVQSLLLKKYFETPADEVPMNWNFKNTQGFNRQWILVNDKPITWSSVSKKDNAIEIFAKIESLEIKRSISLRQNSYILEIVDEFNNSGTKNYDLSQGVRLLREYSVKESPGFLERLIQPQADFEQAVWFADGSLDQELLASVTQSNQSQDAISWAGFSSKYFFFGVIPEWIQSFKLEKIQANVFEESLQLKSIQVPPSEKRSSQTLFYLGPKEISELEKAGNELDRVIDYGNWIGPISRLLLAILRFFHDIIPNYGVGIFLLTLLVKLVLFPLSYKAAVSMKKLSLVQPKMKEIREKFKSNPQRMQAEMMALYRTEKVNPVGGCLPMLIQMPVFFALYRVFFTSIEMRQQPFFGWITDLSQHDPYFVTPVLMTALMYFQQKLTPMPSTGEENEAVRIQKAMFKWMPFIFGAVMIFLPSGLTLYFLVNAFLSILQQVYLNKKLSYLVPPNQRELQQANGRA